MGRKAKGFWKRDESSFWHTRDPLTGKRRSTNCRDLTAAQAWKAARERLAADPIEVAAATAELGEWCDEFIRARRASGRSVSFYEEKLKPWRALFGDGLALSAMVPAAFDQFVESRLSTGVTGHTITKEVNCMIRVLRFAKRANAYPGDLEALRPLDLSKNYVPRTRVLGPAELGALLGELTEERGAFVALCVGLGLRRGEAFTLLPSDVDLVKGIVHVRGTKTAESLRDVPILAPFLGLVKRGAAFLPLRPWINYRRDILAACERAQIPACTANDLRRTHATLLRSAGVDRDVMRRLLGHGAGSTMLETVYDKPSAADLAARVGDLSTLGSQLLGADQKSRRACLDSNQGPTAPEAESEIAHSADFLYGDCDLAATRPRETCRGSAARSTNESQANTPCRPLVTGPKWWRKARAQFARKAAA